MGEAMNRARKCPRCDTAFPADMVEGVEGIPVGSRCQGFRPLIERIDYAGQMPRRNPFLLGLSIECAQEFDLPGSHP